MFHALADATRRDIVARAIEREQSVSALARRYEMSFAAVQKHVAVLERATLIVKQRRGREQIVTPTAGRSRARPALLDAYEQLWIQRTTQIADVLAGEEGDPKMTVINSSNDAEQPVADASSPSSTPTSSASGRCGRTRASSSAGGDRRRTRRRSRATSSSSAGSRATS